MYNGCETCSSKSLVPDPASKDTLGNLTSCTSRCELYSEKMKLKLVWSSKLEKCIISEKSITVCPQNSIDEGPD